MGVAERLTERVSLSLGGKEWRLIITIGVLLDCESATGIESGGVNPLTDSAAALRALLWATLKRSGAKYDQRAVGSHIPKVGIGTIRAALVRAWQASFPETEPAAKGAKHVAKLSWVDYWAESRNHLGLSDEEWLASTPRMIEALRQRRLESIQIQEYLASVIASTSANFSACHPEKMFPLDHFMPHPIKRPEEPMPEITGEYLMGVFAPFEKSKPN